MSRKSKPRKVPRLCDEILHVIRIEAILQCVHDAVSEGTDADIDSVLFIVLGLVRETLHRLDQIDTFGEYVMHSGEADSAKPT